MPNDIYFPQLPEHNNAKITQYFILNHPVTGRAIKIKIKDFLNSVGLGLPDQTGHAGEYLTNDGTNLSWSNVLNIPAIDITYLALKALKTAGTLEKGATYKITDRYNYQSNGAVGIPNLSFLGDDRGLVYIKALEVNVLSKEVIRIMACPTNYSIAGSSIGMWSIGKSVIAGNTTIWGTKVWANTSGLIGTSTNNSVLGAGWTLITKALNTGNVYTDKQFFAIYDFDTDWFDLQRDDRGNEFGCPFNSLNLYNPSNVNHCDFTDWNTYTDTGATAFYNNKMVGYLNNQQCITYDNIIHGVVLNNSISDIFNNNYHGSIEDISTNYTFVNNELRYGFNLPISVDITADTTFVLPPSIYGNSDTKIIKDIILTSSNATESIDLFDTILFSATEKHKIRFKPASGLEVTFVSNLGGGTYVPVCEGGISAVINGTNGDWIEFEKSSVGIIQTNIGTY